MRGLPLFAQILLFVWYVSPVWIIGLAVYLLRRENRTDEPWDEPYDFPDEHDRETSE